MTQILIIALLWSKALLSLFYSKEAESWAWKSSVISQDQTDNKREKYDAELYKIQKELFLKLSWKYGSKMTSSCALSIIQREGKPGDLARMVCKLHNIYKYLRLDHLCHSTVILSMIFLRWKHCRVLRKIQKTRNISLKNY